MKSVRRLAAFGLRPVPVAAGAGLSFFAGRYRNGRPPAGKGAPIRPRTADDHRRCGSKVGASRRAKKDGDPPQKCTVSLCVNHPHYTVNLPLRATDADSCVVVHLRFTDGFTVGSQKCLLNEESSRCATVSLQIDTTVSRPLEPIPNQFSERWTAQTRMFSLSWWRLKRRASTEPRFTGRLTGGN